MNRFIWIVGVFGILVVLLAYGLTQDPSKVPSPLIGKSLPQFNAGVLAQSQQSMSGADLEVPAIINVWASWCVSCVTEHPTLVQLKEIFALPIYGVNYKDTEEDAKQWLKRYGNPYHTVLTDPDGKLGIDLGVYAVPETFVVDHNYIIRYKHIGPLDTEIVRTEIQPLLKVILNEKV